MPFDYTPLAPLGNVGLSHRRPASLTKFLFGAAYYPEHWTAQERADDARRMAAAGLNAVRMAEFAWDRLEPQEGVFDFSFFDEAIAALGRHGVQSILCTPTAAPPRWLTRRFPELLRVDRDGRPLQHGSRQHCCHCNPLFREYSRRITLAMAQHYAGNPLVIGWQTDNEINCHFSECYCSSCAAAFPDYLRARYAGDLDRLNEDWGTSFWALTFERFEDIPLPHETRPAYENPGHRLAFKLFTAENVARFQHDQVALLRAANPDWFVTHNGVFSLVDYRGLFGKDLDFLGYDSYPMFTADAVQRRHDHAFNLDRVRSLCGNFIIPEQQSGPGGQRPYFHFHPEPGELRRMTYVSLARGADSLLYFRWRTCRFGAEEYWCGILDHDDRPRRRYAEVAQTGEELRRIGPELLGTAVRVEAAVAFGDLAVDEAHQSYTLGLPPHWEIAARVHGALYDAGYAAGCIHPADDLRGVKLYVIPHWALFDPAWVPALEAWVREGGVLVVGARTATRDPRNQVVAQTLPGCLAALCGVEVEEYGKLQHQLREQRLQAGGKEVTVGVWYEQLAPAAGTEIVARWTTRHLNGTPAVTRRAHGRGKVYYVGAYLTADLVAALLPELAGAAGLTPIHPCARENDLEVVLREGAGKRLWFLINHRDSELPVSQPPQGTDLTTQCETGASLTLPPFGVAVIRERH